MKNKNLKGNASSLTETKANPSVEQNVLSAVECETIKRLRHSRLLMGQLVHIGAKDLSPLLKKGPFTSLKSIVESLTININIGEINVGEMPDSRTFSDGSGSGGGGSGEKNNNDCDDKGKDELGKRFKKLFRKKFWKKALSVVLILCTIIPAIWALLDRYFAN